MKVQQKSCDSPGARVPSNAASVGAQVQFVVPPAEPPVTWTSVIGSSPLFFSLMVIVTTSPVLTVVTGAPTTVSVVAGWMTRSGSMAPVAAG